MLSIGLIGTGAIGSNVVQAIRDGMVPDARVVSVYNRTPERAHSLVDRFDTDHSIEVASDPLEVSEKADVVVEAASPTVIEEYGLDILRNGADLILLSVGAFHDTDLLSDVRTVATKHDVRVYAPSGAIAALDAIGAMGNREMDDVTLIGYRPARYYGPYLDEEEEVESLREGDVIFEGTAAEAAKEYPEHLNVAIELALSAKVDPENVQVRLEVDSSTPQLQYIIRARGAAGSIECDIENVKTDSDPETSQVIVLSVIERLRRISEPVVIGT